MFERFTLLDCHRAYSRADHALDVFRGWENDRHSARHNFKTGLGERCAVCDGHPDTRAHTPGAGVTLRIEYRLRHVVVDYIRGVEVDHWSLHVGPSVSNKLRSGGVMQRLWCRYFRGTSTRGDEIPVEAGS